MQFQAGHGNKLDLLMDENTYTSTIVSPNFENLFSEVVHQQMVSQIRTNVKPILLANLTMPF